MANLIDDPQTIDAFFARLNEPLKSLSDPQVAHEKFTPDSEAEDIKVVTGATSYDHGTSNTSPVVDESTVQSAVTSPNYGLRVPPTTPANNTVAAAEKSSLLPCIDEDQTEALVMIAGQSKLKLKDSQFAPKQFTPIAKDKTSLPHLGYGANKLDFEPKLQSMTSVQVELSKKLGRPLGGADNYHDQVVANFKTNPEVVERVKATQMLPEISDKNHLPSYENASINALPVAYHEESTIDSGIIREHAGQVMLSSSPYAASPATSPMIVPVLDAGSPKSSTKNTESLDGTDNLVATGPQAVETTSPEQANNMLASKIAKVTIEKKEAEVADDVAACPNVQAITEDREHATVFKSWGTPVSRNTPASRTRKIILSGLPPKANLTMVQSLMHGGPIDTMGMSANGTAAYVIFTTSEACDNYHNKYPNGLVFKLKGKSHTVFVDKSKDVDVISGMLEGHLGAGASRVVRAIGADEDWSMRALSKIAEGKNGRREVESIIDSFRDELRTITFRFTCIADAVTFKSTLRRDPDWEFADIQFVADPCEKATDIHFD